MVLRFVFMLLFVTCVCTVEYDKYDINNKVRGSFMSKLFPIHDVLISGISKRDAPVGRPSAPLPTSEGGPVVTEKKVNLANKEKVIEYGLKETADNIKIVPKVNPVNVTTSPIAVVNNTSISNSSSTKAVTSQLDIKNPGVLKRGLIVFGGFALLAVGYYVFFKRTTTKNEPNNQHTNSDNNQFRYGVLQSDDQRDNLELSRIPLTMESDDDDDDDLEIFDLEQKKKSLSYINLQTNDDDFVITNAESTGHNKETGDKDNLLLDIDTSDTLINWSGSSK